MDGGRTAPNHGGIGFAAGLHGSAAVAWASDTGVDRMRATEWADEAAVVVLDGADASSPALRAAVESVDANGFTLRWDVARPAAVDVHCVAIGGSGLTAAVGRLEAPVEVGPQSLRGAGFRPDLLLVAGSSCKLDGRPGPGLLVSFGAAVAGGSQAVVAMASSAAPGTVGGCQRVGAVLAAPVTDGSKGVSALARVSSFDTDGATLDWDSVDGVGSASYLALSGAGCELGVDVMPRRRRRRTTHLDRVSPAVVFAASWGLHGGDDTRRIARVSLGAASSPVEQGSGVWGVDLAEATQTHTLARSSSTSLVQVPDTRVRPPEEVHAEARLRMFHTRRFTLDWPVADGDRPRQFVYLVLGRRMRPTLSRALLVRDRRRMRRRFFSPR